MNNAKIHKHTVFAGFLLAAISGAYALDNALPHSRELVKQRELRSMLSNAGHSVEQYQQDTAMRLVAMQSGTLPEAEKHHQIVKNNLVTVFNMHKN